MSRQNGPNFGLMLNSVEGTLREVLDNVQDSDILVNKFEFQSHYCIHFWTDALEKGMNPLIPPQISLK